ncbi:MAG: F0F1 ATP synthase subunit A [Ilumatobacteraceae bacterium]
MKLSPDESIIWQYGWFTLNRTILITWILMLVLAAGAKLITSRLKSDLIVSRWQALIEILVLTVEGQIREVGLNKPRKFMGFIGTLFLFIAFATVCSIIPGYENPMSSLSTTSALSLCVFVAVPFYGIAENGLGKYLKSYLQPNFIMLPFNIISEFSRTLALAVRLFGNMMSGGLIIAILLSIAPFFFPVIMSSLDLLTGIVQAYIFSILATVYITAATQGEV